MLLWTLSILCAIHGLRLLVGDFAAWSVIGGLGAERARVREVAGLLQELEETLGAGVVPEASRWDALRRLPDPWGELAHQSLQELRACGGALLPTLRRLRALAQDHDAALGEARARSSQALGQALVCALLVPVFGSALYFLLPGIEPRATAWLAACMLALLMAGAGALWMLAMAEQARWAGLSAERRPWVLAAQCAGERFLALVRSGNPTDLAWTRACALLKTEAAGLAERWGASVWKPADAISGPGSVGHASTKGLPPAALALVEAGAGLRKAVQVSLMEGKPCTERVETALAALRQDLRAQIERELALLGTRALKPLFLCVAPALLLLLGFGMALSWEQVAGGSGGF